MAAKDFEPRASCRNCVFLFTRDGGYSNWTVMDTSMHCVRKRNPAMLDDGAEMPDEFPDTPILRDNPLLDRWYVTSHARCDEYTIPDPSIPLDPHMHHIDCDGDDIMAGQQAVDHALTSGDPMPLLISRYFKKDDTRALK